MSEAYRTMLWNYQGNVGDKDRLAMEEAVVAYYNQEAKLSDETFKIRKQIQSIQNSGANADASAAAAASKKAEAEWKKQQELLKKIEEVHAKWATIADAGAIAGGVSPTFPGVITPTLTVLPRVDAEYWKETITAQLGDFTIGIGVKADTEKIHDITSEVNSLLESSITQTSEIIGNLVGTLAGGGDAWGDFKNAALSAFGDMAIAVGKIAIQVGLADAGIEVALKSGQWQLAVAAGAALVALGSAVKSSLSAVASGDYSAAGGGYSGSYSGTGSDNGYETREVNVYVTGTLEADGDKLITVINNTNRKNYYTQ